jgi:aerobic-type carbon monoxide dehydrogenase small subunit (CoxS/CutS family)
MGLRRKKLAPGSGRTNPAPAPSPTVAPEPVVTRRLVHGEAAAVVERPESTSLLAVVRESLGLRSVARGCTDGRCGSCRVLLDGALVNTCTMPLGAVRDGASLEIYEDIETEADARSAVAAFDADRPTRCRLCVAGLGLTAVWLGRRGARHDEAAIDGALEDATCMCTGRGSLRRSLLTTK